MTDQAYKDCSRFYRQGIAHPSILYLSYLLDTFFPDQLCITQGHTRHDLYVHLGLFVHVYLCLQSTV